MHENEEEESDLVREGPGRAESRQSYHGWHTQESTWFGWTFYVAALIVIQLVNQGSYAVDLISF